MPIEIIGLLWPSRGSEAHPDRPKFEPDFPVEHARNYEASGYDRVLVAQTARSADSMVVASQVLASTTRLKVMLAHRPGFIAPTMAARMLATLDAMSHGRVGVHIITGASDLEIRQDGDYSAKEGRYSRSCEYVEILRALWAANAPIDHEGEFFKFDQAFSEPKPFNGRSLPVFWGGSTPPAIEGAGACADIYAMGSGTVERVSAQVEQVRAAGAAHGRTLEFCMSVRLIMGDTEEAAWKKAHGILDTIEAYQAVHGVIGRGQGEFDERRLAAAMAFKEGPDKRLWTGLTEATKGRATVLSLVGTPEQLTDALLDYYDIGISRFLITGFEPIIDDREIGEKLLPLLRAGAAARG